MTVTHQCVRPGAGGHSVYTPVHCMGTTGWGGHASVWCLPYLWALCLCCTNVCMCGTVVWVQVCACIVCTVIKFYGCCTGTGRGVLQLRIWAY